MTDWSDEDIWNLNRGGQDPHKVYAAFHAAVNHPGQPTLLLPKTIKGYGMGESGEAQNITHQQKKMSTESMRRFRDRFQIPVPDDKPKKYPFALSRPGPPEAEYMKAADGFGRLPPTRRRSRPAGRASRATFERFLKSTDDREISTTMAFCPDPADTVARQEHGQHIVPIVPDESRTSAWKACSVSSHLEPAGAALYTGRC